MWQQGFGNLGMPKAAQGVSRGLPWMTGRKRKVPMKVPADKKGKVLQINELR
jgi:hypothetical protein